MPISQLVRSAVSGMVSHKLSLDVIANNLANVSTTGFKSSRVNFQDVLYQAHRLATSNQDLRVGAGVRPVEIQPFFTQGALQQTESPTDLSIYGNGFFRVQLPDGQTGYTRNGAFHVDANGLLVTSEGLAVQPEIRVPSDLVGTVTVDASGTVRAQRAYGFSVKALQTIDEMIGMANNLRSR